MILDGSRTIKVSLVCSVSGSPLYAIIKENASKCRWRQVQTSCLIKAHLGQAMAAENKKFRWCWHKKLWILRGQPENNQSWEQPMIFLGKCFVFRAHFLMDLLKNCRSKEITLKIPLRVSFRCPERFSEDYPQNRSFSKRITPSTLIWWSAVITIKRKHHFLKA